MSIQAAILGSQYYNLPRAPDAALQARVDAIMQAARRFPAGATMLVATSTAIALALSAAAAGASYYNTQQTAKRQDNAAADQIRQQASRQQEANAKVNDLVKKTADSNPEESKNAALEQYTKQLQQAQGEAGNSITAIGGASDAYKADAEKAQAGIGDYGAKTAGLMSRIDAPVAQRQHEGFMAGDTAAELNRIGSFASGDDFLAKLRQNAIRRNAGLDAFSSLAGGYASGMSTGGGGGSFGGGTSSPFVATDLGYTGTGPP